MSDKQTETKPKKNPAVEAASTRIIQRLQLRWTQEQATLAAVDEVVAEYEPRVAALEAKLSELLQKLGETGDAAKKGGK